MMPREKKSKRANIYFRQTPKEFKSIKQTQIYEHIKRNLPYSIINNTRQKFYSAFTKVHQRIKSWTTKLPEDAKRIK